MEAVDGDVARRIIGATELVSCRSRRYVASRESMNDACREDCGRGKNKEEGPAETSSWQVWLVTRCWDKEIRNNHEGVKGRRERDSRVIGVVYMSRLKLR
jgi:hypothetical protein